MTGRKRMIQIAIIEDEINIHKEILQFVYEGIHQRKEIGVDIFSSAEEYLAVNQKYEMVITDIELPGISGLELGKRIKQIYSDIYLVFLTSYSEFASESYVIEAYQYILKRDMSVRLPMLVDKVIAKIEKEYTEFCWIGNYRDFKKLYYRDIIYVKKLKGTKYTEYVTNQGKYTERISLNHVFSELSKRGFILADRAYIVNINHVQRMRRNIIYMDNGEEIKVNRAHDMEIKEKIAECWRNLR